MDSVSIAFELMRLELNAEVESLNDRGAKHFRQSEYERAKDLSERGKTLFSFCETINHLAERWEQDFSPNFPKSEKKTEEAVRKILFATKASKTGLLVRFPDGVLIAEQTAAKTLVKVIQKIGFEEVRSQNIMVNKENLVSKSQSTKYHDQHVPPYFIKTHSSTEQKKKNLEQLSGNLGLNIEIEIIS